MVLEIGVRFLFLTFGAAIFVLASAFYAFADENLESTDVNGACNDGLTTEVYSPAREITLYGHVPPNPGQRRETATVQIDALCVMQNEVSWEFYSQCIADGVCELPLGAPADSDGPVHSISILGALEFAAWLSAETDLEYRLPSEAEWQGFSTLTGMNPWNWQEFINRQEENIMTGTLRASGEGPETVNGIRNLFGNVSEFVDGCYSASLSPVEASFTDHFPDECEFVQVRGGHYLASREFSSPYFRIPIPADFSSPQIGMRLVRTLN